MAAQPSQAKRVLSPLELLRFAGWQLRVQEGEQARIRATRADVELQVAGAALAEAAGIVFARAMRSSRGRRQPAGD